MPSFTIKQLFEAEAHLGHLPRFRDPKMAMFLYRARDGKPIVKNRMHVINLDETRERFREALQFISRISERSGSKILFVGTKRVAQAAIKEQAIRAGMPYVDRRWLGGMLTNYRTIHQLVKRLKELEMMRQEGEFKAQTKKEKLNLQRELFKLERDVGGIKEMVGLPDALFVVDVGEESIAVGEARRLKIPIVGIVDTNCSPQGIDYVIPANDDKASAVRLYISLVADIILEALALRSPSVSEAPERKEPIIKTTRRKLQVGAAYGTSAAIAEKNLSDR